MDTSANKKMDEHSEKKPRIQLKNVIDGSALSQDYIVSLLPYILFLALLSILYIANRYHAEKIARETIKTHSELKELRAESITTASKLMFISKQSEVLKLVNKHNLELKEAVEPPKKIKIK